MDNAVEAMLMAFSMIVFVIAISLAIYMGNLVQSTSEVLLYAADETNYYDNIEVTSDDISNQIERYVDADTVIATLYRYYKENFSVKIVDNVTNIGNNDLIQVFDLNLEGKVRTAAATTRNLTREQSALRTLYNNKTDPIYMFEAPWMANPDVDTKKRVDLFISGKAAYINNAYVDYTSNNLQKYIVAGKRFKETFVQYNFSGDTFTNDEGETLVNSRQSNSKIVITYTIEEQLP